MRFWLAGLRRWLGRGAVAPRGRLRSRALLAVAHDWHWSADAAGERVRLEPALAERTAGAPPIDHALVDLFGADAPRLAAMLRTGRPFRRLMVTLIDPADGAERKVALAAVPLLDAGGRPVGWDGCADDLSSAFAAAEQARLCRARDMATGLPSREAVLAALRVTATPALGRARPWLLVLRVDWVDLPERIAPASAADRILGRLAARLDGPELRILGRTGERELALQAGPGPATAAREQAAMLMAAIGSEPLVLDGTTLTLVAGACAVPIAATVDPERLLRRAGIEAHRSLLTGEPALSALGPAIAAERRQVGAEPTRDDGLAAELAAALAEDRLELAFQPERELAGGAVIGVEALLRWTHPRHGAVPPGLIVALAEEVGLAERLARWVLGAACAAASALPELRLSVNLAPAALDRLDPAAAVREALERAGLAPQRLELELPEAWILEHWERACALAQALRTAGVGLVLDDLGRGYTELAHRAPMPLARVKIDRRFVAELGRGPASLLAMRGLIGLARGLAPRLCAEGVERAETAALLAELGCDEIQGHLVHPPVSAAALADWLTVDRALQAVVA